MPLPRRIAAGRFIRPRFYTAGPRKRRENGLKGRHQPWEGPLTGVEKAVFFIDRTVR